MKKLIVLTLVLLASPALAEQYCEWSGTEGVNCQNDNKGYVRTSAGLPVGGGVSNYNDNGLFLLSIVEPTLGVNEVRDQDQWSFDGSVITRTWSTRTLTAQEIQDRDDQIAHPQQDPLRRALPASLDQE